MTQEKDEDLSDFIRSQIKIEWDELKTKIPGMPTEELVELMVKLKLYVNKTLALEIAKRDDAVFYLRKLIQDGRHWRNNGPGDGWSPIHAIHILALIKSKETLPLLLDTVRYHEDDLSDWLTESVPGLLVAFGENAIETLKEFTMDETLESFARGVGVTALATLARKYPSHKDEVKEHIIKLLNTTSDTTFASIIADDLAFLHDSSVMPEIKRAFEEGKIGEFRETLEEIERIVKGEYDESEMHTEDHLDHFSRKEIEYLHNLHYAKPEEKYKKCHMGKELP